MLMNRWNITAAKVLSTLRLKGIRKGNPSQIHHISLQILESTSSSTALTHTLMAQHKALLTYIRTQCEEKKRLRQWVPCHNTESLWQIHHSIIKKTTSAVVNQLWLIVSRKSSQSTHQELCSQILDHVVTRTFKVLLKAEAKSNRWVE